MEGMSKTAPPERKRRKIDPPFRGTVSSSAAKRTGDATFSSLTDMQPPVPQGVDPKIQQLKNYAVAQAQQDGCTGNFRIFDSPYGNFLVPVIPTRAELTR